MYFPHFIMRVNGYTLWQKGHYQYEIERKGIKRLIMDSCENAVSILNDEYGV